MELLIWVGENNPVVKKGNIVITRDDGFYGEPSDGSRHGYNHKLFRLVKVVGEQRDISLQETYEIGGVKKCKYKVDISLAVKDEAILITRKDLNIVEVA